MILSVNTLSEMLWRLLVLISVLHWGNVCEKLDEGSSVLVTLYVKKRAVINGSRLEDTAVCSKKIMSV